MGTGILPVLALAGGFLFFCLTRGQKMREDKRVWAELLWYAGGLIPLTVVTLVWTGMENQAVPQRVLLIALGAFLGGLALYAVGEAIRPSTAQSGATVTDPTKKDPPLVQQNQSGPNINVPGSGNQFNIYPTPQAPADTGVIYQGGVVVGKVFGARRLPNDATTFEFNEITNCQQFHTGAPFLYGGVKLQFVGEKNSVMMLAGRIADSPIRFGVIAKVLE